MVESENEELVDLVDHLRTHPTETEWLEFKKTKVQPPEVIGEYLSALSNSAALAQKSVGYLVLGIDDETHKVVGTSYGIREAKVKKNQNLLFWTIRGLEPRVHLQDFEISHPDGRVVLLEVGPAPGRPVKFYGKAFIRVGESKTALSEHPQKEAALWNLHTDWSAQVIEEATIDDLDAEAIAKAREEFREKNPQQANDSLDWNEVTFLNKAKVTRQGKITNAAILLLGKAESSSLLSPAVARISWLLKSNSGEDLDYKHFDPPFILRVEDVVARIRNLTLRALPDGTLFPTEIQQYDSYILREALHNAIAHQDYGLQGRIQVVETPSKLLITNVGSFLPGSVERVIHQDAPEEIYRNPFLAIAMVNLNMIDTQGGGIRKMFQRQLKRFLPLPDYDLSSPDRVRVTIPGQILDEKYTKLLMERTEIDLWQALLLDQVQKEKRIPHEAHKKLRSEGLVEGRYPNTILSGPVARAIGRSAEHIRARGFNNQYYRDLVLKLVREHGPVSREEVDALLLDKLPEVLDEEQKRTKINNILKSLSRPGRIVNEGSRRYSRWVIGGKS